MNKRIGKKGFTLIELLAVIIILAILMTLAITAMSGYIRNAKKDTYVTTALQYANAVRLSFVNGEYSSSVMPSRGQCLAVSTNKISLESGSHKSSFGNSFSANSYVIIYNNSTTGEDKYDYYIQMSDSKGNGFGVLDENGLDGKLVIEKDAEAEDNFQSSIAAGGSISLYKAISDSAYESTASATCTVSGVVS